MRIWREPLVLFYREGESVARVVAALELSEDALQFQGFGGAGAGGLESAGAFLAQGVEAGG